VDRHDIPARLRLTGDRSDPATDRVLRELAPPSTTVGSRWIDESDLERLHPGERSSVAGAVLARRREFAAGRVLLRRLLGTTETIPVGPSRRPVLPVGVQASLAHDDQLVVAVVTRDPSVRALGIDVEPSTVLPDELAALICRPDERVLDAHLAFTLKEAAYKAWSALGGELLEHHDVQLDVGEGCFTATVLRSGLEIGGRFGRAGDRWLALAAVGG
jgi:4'-phosphopantetheinyl transferase EntD